MTDITKRLAEALRAMVCLIYAHNIESLSCDNDGERYCDCLSGKAGDAMKVLQAYDAQAGKASGNGYSIGVFGGRKADLDAISRDPNVRSKLVNLLEWMDRMEADRQPQEPKRSTQA